MSEKVVIPTGELIRNKDCDFRVILGISGLSDCDGCVSYEELNSLHGLIGIDKSNFNKKLRVLIKKKSNEFKLVNGKKCCASDSIYKIDVINDNYIKIPRAMCDFMLSNLSNNAIKLYCIIIYLSHGENGLNNISLSQPVLCSCMGLSYNSEKVVRSATEELIKNNLIKVKMTSNIVHEFTEDGLPFITSKDMYEYMIVDKDIIELVNINYDRIDYIDSYIDKSENKNTSRKICQRRDDMEYIKWRISVLNRDNYTCLNCGKHGDDAVLNVHHIKRYADNEELRTDVDNGITLCYECHKKTLKKEEEFEEHFKQLIQNK